MVIPEPTPSVCALADQIGAMVSQAIRQRNIPAALAAVRQANQALLGESAATTIAELELNPKLESLLDSIGVIYLTAVKGRSTRSLAELPGVGCGWANQLFRAIKQSASIAREPETHKLSN